MVIFFIPYLAYKEALDTWTSTGYSDGIWIFGTIIYTCLVASMFVRVVNLTSTWTIWTHAFFWGSVALFILFLYTFQVSFFIVFIQLGFFLKLFSFFLCFVLVSLVVRDIIMEYVCCRDSNVW